MSSSRRTFMGRALLSGAAAIVTSQMRTAHAADCPFRVAVINDEISQDLDHACYVAAHDFGLKWIELRSMWDKNVTELGAADLDKARAILAKYSLRVTDIASPLFKTDWPGAPLSKESPRRDQFKASFDFKEQDALLDHCIHLAKTFATDRVRCFDFWRLDDQRPYRQAINRKLSEAARKCAKQNIVLLLENEMACNTGSGPEAAQVLAAVPEPNFMLNWDPGNSATFAGDTPFPDDYRMLPFHRIGHCHVKDTVRKPDGKFDWAPVGGGIIDWTGQFRALAHDGYHFAVSLETHWRGAGTPEASTRVSMNGLKTALANAGTGC